MAPSIDIGALAVAPWHLPMGHIGHMGHMARDGPMTPGLSRRLLAEPRRAQRAGQCAVGLTPRQNANHPKHKAY